jgi:UDP-glucuronate 4-epimerase
MRVLVTGAAGFIGSHTVDALIERGDHVVGVDNFNDYYDPKRKRANIAHLADHPRFRLVEADVRDADGMAELFEHDPLGGSGTGFDAIVHLAAMANVRYSIGRAPLYYNVNVQGTINLLELAVQHQAGNFVFASTSSVYGRTEQLPFLESDPCNQPLAPYPATKKTCEVLGYSYHNLHALNFTALRFFSVYGPRGRPDMMPYMVTDRIFRGEKITLYDAGRMQRDWTYVDDIVSGVLAALDRPLGYEILNLGRGEPVWMDEFVQLVEELIGKRALLSTPPAPPSEPPVTYANIDKARRLLDYHPATAVADGMWQLWGWYQAEVLGGEHASRPA